MTHRSTLAVLAALLLACLPATATLAQAKPADRAPVEGVDYELIANGRPWQPLAGKIEVVEIFAYSCHHCHDFQSNVDQWKKTLPKDVRFTYLPAAFDPQDSYARAYFAAESLGAQDRTHHATYRAIHDTQALPSRGASIDEFAAFYAGLGLNAARVKAAMQSKASDAKMQAAREFAVRSDIEGTPTLIVNGKYRVRGRSLADILRIADALIAGERNARTAPTPNAR